MTRGSGPAFRARAEAEIERYTLTLSYQMILDELEQFRNCRYRSLHAGKL
jgi:hypothetical protein